jgi:hypothetical protein
VRSLIGRRPWQAVIYLGDELGLSARFILEIDVGERPAVRVPHNEVCSSIDHGGGKRRAEFCAVNSHRAFC